MCMQVSRITDIITDADSLRLRFPKLASMKPESGSLHLTFLNLAAQLKFSVAIPLGEHYSCLHPVPWSIQHCSVILHSMDCRQCSCIAE